MEIDALHETPCPIRPKASAALLLHIAWRHATNSPIVEAPGFLVPLRSPDSGLMT
jgi:hypothetical protein